MADVTNLQGANKDGQCCTQQESGTAWRSAGTDKQLMQRKRSASTKLINPPRWVPYPMEDTRNNASQQTSSSTYMGPIATPASKQTSSSSDMRPISNSNSCPRSLTTFFGHNETQRDPPHTTGTQPGHRSNADRTYYLDYLHGSDPTQRVSLVPHICLLSSGIRNSRIHFHHTQNRRDIVATRSDPFGNLRPPFFSFRPAATWTSR